MLYHFAKNIAHRTALRSTASFAPTEHSSNSRQAFKHKNTIFHKKNEVPECRPCSVKYFVCDWWFNVDCSTAESFYSLNEQIAAERAENSPPGTVGGQYKGRPAAGAAKNGQTGVAAASGGYARYYYDFSAKNNSGSFHFLSSHHFNCRTVNTHNKYTYELQINSI
jgi:hypothetical protein